MNHNGKANSQTLFREMQDWLQRKLPIDAKDDLNRVQDFFEVSFASMSLALFAASFEFSLDDFPQHCEFDLPE